jgi:hypothetical protein
VCLHLLALIHEETTPFPSLILATLKALSLFSYSLFFHLSALFCSLIYSPTSTTTWPAMAKTLQSVHIKRPRKVVYIISRLVSS